jgi:uncharacterized protein YjdB
MSRVRRIIRFALMAIVSSVIACASDATTTEIQTIVNNVVVSLGLSRLTVGQTVQADAIARDAGGAALKGVTVSWRSSNANVASVTTAGLVTALAPGQADIIATVGTVVAQTTVTVVAFRVASISVGLSVNTTSPGQQLTATAVVRDSSNVVLTDRQVAWSSSNVAVATVSPIGAIAAIAPGTASITATSEGVSGSANLTVQSSVRAISVFLPATRLSIGDSTTAQATVRDASNNILIDKPVSWSSSDITIATVTASGRVVAVTPGTVTITATSEGTQGAAALTVSSPVRSVAVTLGASTLLVGGQTTATDLVKDANNNVLTDRSVAWTSSNNAVAQVSPAGVVTAVAIGTANIVATVEGVAGSAPLTVNGSGGGGGTQTPTQLVIVSQPTSVVSGVDIAPPVVIEVRDASNALVTSSNAFITVTLASGGGTLAGTTTMHAVAGRATFSDLRINGSGTSSLAFSAAGLTGATSSTFAVTAALAAQMTITTQPSSTGQVAVAFAQQPVVQLRDASNAPVNQAGVVVTASIATGGGALGGTTVVTTNGFGVATFTDLSISGAVGSRRLVFTAIGQSTPQSNTIAISAGSPAQLAISTQPAPSASTGVVLAQQPTIQVRDVSNNAVSQAGIAVTASIATGSGTIGGTLTATTDPTGLAAFTNLSVTGSGAYTLRFAATGLSSTVSNTISLGAGAPTKLSITTQPSSSATSGTAFGQQPVIQLRDASDIPVSQSGVVITATIATGAGSLDGIAIATTNANGVATFSNLTITGSGAYTVQFEAPGLTSATSNSITVSSGSSGGSAEPTPSGTIVLDWRAGGKQDMQAVGTLAAFKAYYTSTTPLAGELDDVTNGNGNATLAFTTNYDGNGKHALRVDWPANPGNFDSGANTAWYFNTTIDQLYCSFVIHLGRTATGGGIGTVGSFSPTSPGGGSKRWFALRQPGDGTDRVYWVWGAGDPSVQSQDVQIDNRNWNSFFNTDFGIGQDVRWTFRVIPASSPTASDGIVQAWRNGVMVMNDQAANVGNQGFQQFITMGTRHDVLQAESEYWTDLVVWRP